MKDIGKIYYVQIVLTGLHKFIKYLPRGFEMIRIIEVLFGVEVDVNQP